MLRKNFDNDCILQFGRRLLICITRCSQLGSDALAITVKTPFSEQTYEGRDLERGYGAKF